MALWAASSKSNKAVVVIEKAKSKSKKKAKKKGSKKKKVKQKTVYLGTHGGRVCFMTMSIVTGKSKPVPGLCRPLSEVFGLSYGSKYEGVKNEHIPGDVAQNDSSGWRWKGKRGRTKSGMAMGKRVDKELGDAIAYMKPVKTGIWAVTNRSKKPPSRHPFTSSVLKEIHLLGLTPVSTQCVVWCCSPRLLATAVDVLAFNPVTQNHVVIEVKVCRLAKKDYGAKGKSSPRNLPPRIAACKDINQTSLMFTHQMQLCATLHMFNKSHPDKATKEAYVIVVNSTGARSVPLHETLIKHSTSVLGTLSREYNKKKKS